MLLPRHKRTFEEERDYAEQLGKHNGRLADMGIIGIQPEPSERRHQFRKNRAHFLALRMQYDRRSLWWYKLGRAYYGGYYDDEEMIRESHT